MTYTITITNSKIGMTSAQILYLSTISPSLIVNPDKPYEEYVSDVKLDSTDIYVPLYKRNQLVKLPANSVLVIYTEDSEESAYYKSQRLDGSSVLVDPDPITGDSIVDSLKDLYVALGNDASSVENANTILEVLNVMSESYQGESNASSISDAVDNIAAVADNIGGGDSSLSPFLSVPYIYHDVYKPGNRDYSTVACCYFPIDNNGTFDVTFEYSNVQGEFSKYGGTAILAYPATKIILHTGAVQGGICFTPSENFDGIYVDGEKITTSGTRIIPGDGKLYLLEYDDQKSEDKYDVYTKFSNAIVLRE